jgi:hypothetical protein
MNLNYYVYNEFNYYKDIQQNQRKHFFKYKMYHNIKHENTL